MGRINIINQPAIKGYPHFFGRHRVTLSKSDRAFGDQHIARVGQLNGLGRGMFRSLGRSMEPGGPVSSYLSSHGKYQYYINKYIYIDNISDSYGMIYSIGLSKNDIP